MVVLHMVEKSVCAILRRQFWVWLMCLFLNHALVPAGEKILSTRLPWMKKSLLTSKCILCSAEICGVSFPNVHNAARLSIVVRFRKSLSLK